MPINNPTVQQVVRQPRLQILLDGKPLPGALSASWTQSSHYTPDVWSATFALNDDPRFGPQWWDNRDTPLTLDVQAGLIGVNGVVQWTSLGVGMVDEHQFSADLTTVEVQGRDLSLLMLAQPTAETFQNQTASEIVTAIAGRHGLTGDVTATQLPVQRYYESDHTVTTHASGGATTEWDLLVKLAQTEGFDLYMRGNTLHFHPTVDPASDPYAVRFDPMTAERPEPQAGVRNLQMTRRFVLARPVTVLVKSFHSKTGKAVTGKASFGNTSVDTSVGGQHGSRKVRPTRYVFVRPNLTQDQADKMAQRLLDDIIRHERTIEWQEPGNTLLTPRHMVRLEGTGTGFDQVYYVETVTRTVAFNQGFTMSVRAKNNSPEAANASPD